MKTCSVCSKAIEREDAPILTISAYGNPRYLCDECAAEIESAMFAKEPSEIEHAMDRLGKKASGPAHSDTVTLDTLAGLMSVSAERLEKIKEGTYDFACDEKLQAFQTDDSFVEVPEELQETEEDRELDRQDEEKQKKFDKVTNWISLGVIAAILIYFIIKLLSK